MTRPRVDPGIAAPHWPAVLGDWRFDPVIVAVLLAALIGYLALVAAAARRMGWRWPARRIAAFVVAVAVTAAVLLSPLQAYANALFTVHMIQHVVLIMIVPVLLVLAMPVSLLLHALDRRRRRRVLKVLRSAPIRLVSFPVVAFGLYVAVVAGTHLTGFYQLVLTHPAAEQLEHVLYLVVGYLYWLPIIGREPVRWRMHHGLRLLMVLLAMPVDAFVGLALVSTTHEPFPALAAAGRTWGPPLVIDLHDGGAVMWIGGDLIMAVVIIALVVPDWMRAERRHEAQVDAETRRRIAARRQALRPGQQHGRELR